MAIRSSALLLLVLLIGGCTPGWLYTDIVTPACTNMDSTPVSTLSSSAGWRQINIPRLPGARTVWSSNAIADAAQRGGITNLEYCDRQQFSVLGGLWGRDSIVVYGEAPQEGPQ